LNVHNNVFKIFIYLAYFILSASYETHAFYTVHDGVFAHQSTIIIVVCGGGGKAV
jgi:hypothetical protein